MKRSEFRDLACSRLLILDGATGTQLALRGMSAGVCPETWVLENPEAILGVQGDYRAAGSDIVYTCTFGGNRVKLAEYDAADRLAAINREHAALTRKAVGAGFAFGDLAPTGQFPEPFGETPFEEAVAIYKEQVEALVEGGVDGFIIETMMDVQEARAALLAVRETCDLPAMVSLTFGDDGRTLTGTDPVSALVTLQAVGADAVGCNCSTGPEGMLPLIQAMKPHATVPLMAKPNAGQPRLRDGQTVFDMDAATFGSYVEAFVEAGVNILGGCCGTTPDHIRAAAEAGKGMKVEPPRVRAVSILSSSQSHVAIGPKEPVRTIGERINPTGKKKLQADLREGSMALVRQYAQEQTKAGADILDVNMGLSGIDEGAMMEKAVKLVSQVARAPLCLDSTDPEVMERALRIYPGRALVNSVTLETDRIERMLPLAAKYGAMLVVLPVTDEGIPKTLEDRQAVTRRILAHAEEHGYLAADIVVDGLVMTVSAEPEAAALYLDFIQWCAEELRVNTTGGLSNVSFGMPERKWINATLLAMAIARGLTCPIVNPCSEMMMAVKLAADALTERDRKLATYLARFGGGDKPTETKSGGEAEAPLIDKQVFNAVLQGEDDRVAGLIETALAEGMAAQAIADDCLIPAILEVGERYDKKEYFLPQLMMSADTMRAGFQVLEPHLAKAGDGQGLSRKAVVLLATVQGDIHDIGKNIVALMLRNYGFEVKDLGKDVAAAEIVKAIREHEARIVGLSALMTTTMTEMQTVIDLARAEGLEDVHFMVGGAVVDENYANEIGAAGYARDAVEAVRLAEKLSDEE